MAYDPEFVAEARAWLLKANSDLRSAELIAGSDPALAGYAFAWARSFGMEFGTMKSDLTLPGVHLRDRPAERS